MWMGSIEIGNLDWGYARETVGRFQKVRGPTEKAVVKAF